MKQCKMEVKKISYSHSDFTQLGQYREQQQAFVLSVLHLQVYFRELVSQSVSLLPGIVFIKSHKQRNKMHANLYYTHF